MAIVQISRITNRKGLRENLPQLAGAELGWCLDTRQLFIGNGTLEEGAPLIGNTEILTEFSDIAALANYTYSDVAVGYAAQTGASPSSPVVRTVAAKLDDFASVRDFGAVGDGVADDTAAINRALYQLYCRESNNTQTRRRLYFPAGTYLVSDTMLIPTWAELVGEGPDHTIIYLNTTDSSNPGYVARFADSLQQYGANIGTNGATLPREIVIRDMTFQSGLSADVDVVLVDSATQCSFENVNFRGILSAAPPDALDNLTGVVFNGACEQINFTRCRFNGLTYGINTDQPVAATTVIESAFTNLYKGVVLADPTAVSGGPTGFRVISSFFDNVYAQGIVYGASTLCVSAQNIFYDVGNDLGGSPVTAVIEFYNDTCASVSDLFARTNSENNQVNRVAITVTSPSSDPVGLATQLGRWARNGGLTFTIPDNSSGTTVTSTNPSLVRALSMDYTMVRDGDVRHGLFTVSSAGIGTAVFSDDFTETAALGVVLSAAQVGNTTLNISANTTSTGANVSLTYSITHLA